MDRLELLDRAAPWVIGDQMAEFAKNVTSNFDHVLVTHGHSEMRKDRLSCIRLQIFVVRHELDYPIPDFRSNMVASG
jgi:hypothetical protein